MVQWFQERYIPREEHQRIVDYYRKLVARLYGNVRELRDLRTLIETQMTADIAAADDPPPRAETRDFGPNVVSLDTHRRRHHSGR